MALIKCPDCGQEVSNQAVACIKCGCPLATSHKEDDMSFMLSKRRPPERSHKSSGKGWIAWLILLLLALVLYGWIGGWLPSSWFRSKSDLEASITRLMQENFSKTPALNGIHVENVTLVSSGGNNYTGIASVDRNGEKSQLSIKVEADNDNVMYRIDPASAIALALKSTFGGNEAPIPNQNQSRTDATPTQQEQTSPDVTATDANNPSTQSDNKVLAFNTDAYCRDVSNNVGGSSEIELSCRNSEEEAKQNIQSHKTSSRIFNYCKNISMNVGGSYEIMASCIQQEESAQSQLNSSP